MRSPIELLSEKISLERLDLGADIWHYAIKTPAYKFRIYVWMDAMGKHLFQFTQRDGEEAELAICINDFIGKHGNWGDVSAPLTVETGFKCQGWRFDTVCVLAASAHKSYVGEVPELHGRTLVVFPAYQCEFSGSESAKEVEFMRTHLVSTVDMYRSPFPKVRVWYRNLSQKSGSVGKEPKLDSLDVLRRVVADLPADSASLAKVVNYKGAVFSIRREADGYYVSEGGADFGFQRVAKIQLWIDDFVGL